LAIGNEYSDMLFALFLIGVVLLLPDGIIGAVGRLRYGKKAGSEPTSGTVTSIRSATKLHEA
jgi:hypothetical protein